MNSKFVFLLLVAILVTASYASFLEEFDEAYGRLIKHCFAKSLKKQQLTDHSRGSRKKKEKLIQLWPISFLWNTKTTVCVSNQKIRHILIIRLRSPWVRPQLSLLLIQIYFRDPATDCFIVMVLLLIIKLWEIFISQINGHNLHICLDSSEAVPIADRFINWFLRSALSRHHDSCPCPEEAQCGEVCAENRGSVSLNFTK